MAADAILNNPKSRYIGSNLTDRHIWHDDAYWPSEPDQQLKFRTFKNPRWLHSQTAKYISEKPKI